MQIISAKQSIIRQKLNNKLHVLIVIRKMFGVMVVIWKEKMLFVFMRHVRKNFNKLHVLIVLVRTSGRTVIIKWGWRWLVDIQIARKNFNKSSVLIVLVQILGRMQIIWKVRLLSVPTTIVNENFK